MTEAERVNAAWDRIEKWYSQNMPDHELSPGVSAEGVQAFEAHLKLTIPDGLKASLLRHNGLEPGKWPKYSQLLSIEEIKEEWDMKNSVFPDGEQFEGYDDNGGRFQPVYWCSSWIPIDADGCGDGSCVDLKPGPNGKLGQVIYIDHDVGPDGPKFDSYVEYLEDIAVELEAGKHKNGGGYVEAVD